MKSGDTIVMRCTTAVLISLRCALQSVLLKAACSTHLLDATSVLCLGELCAWENILLDMQMGAPS